jgi:hypothetical protein
LIDVSAFTGEPEVDEETTDVSTTAEASSTDEAQADAGETAADAPKPADEENN